VIRRIRRWLGLPCDHDWFEDGVIEHEDIFLFTYICATCGDLLLVRYDPEGE